MYLEKVKKLKSSKEEEKTCKTCKKKIPQGRWSYCSQKCLDASKKETQKVYWTRIIKIEKVKLYDQFS